MSAIDAYLSEPWLAHYPPGVSAAMEVPRASVPEAFDAACRQNAERDAVVFYGRRIRYGELREAADSFAAALASLGIAKGDRIALYLVNSPQFIIAYFGALKAGAVVTPISPVYTSHEVRHQLADSGARAIICQDVLYDKVARTGLPLDFVVLTNVAEYLPALKRVLGQGPLGKLFSALNTRPPQVARAPNVLWLQDLLRRHPAKPPAIEFDPERDLAALPYTGGTTGNPKGVMLTHANLIAACVGAQSAFPFFEAGREVVLAFLPFFHIYGQVVIMLNGLCQGYLLILFANPDTEAILAAMERHRATVFYGVPTLYEYLKDHKDTGKADWKRLKILVSGADTLHESTLRDWERRTGSTITEGYGLTETCAISHINPAGRAKPGSFGCPLSNMHAAVIDPETGAFVAPGEAGELILAGPNVMQGYWNQPGETAKAFIDAGGRRWLRTGDIVRMDTEGYFFFHDRAKDLIKCKGYSIFAKDIEEVLYAHPQVKAAGVIGIPDPSVGQLVKAIVVLQGDARGKVSEEDMRLWCRERLAEYKVPAIIEFRGELPKTDVGKVSRRELRDEHS
ncbi:MAG: AMP-binding protein [Betaproteobacteria bacterium]|nr:AMP-binding protein [Betaproteobacteria bacterium]